MLLGTGLKGSFCVLLHVVFGYDGEALVLWFLITVAGCQSRKVVRLSAGTVVFM